jgi:hypothetical protein
LNYCKAFRNNGGYQNTIIKNGQPASCRIVIVKAGITGSIMQIHNKENLDVLRFLDSFLTKAKNTKFQTKEEFQAESRKHRRPAGNMSMQLNFTLFSTCAP